MVLNHLLDLKQKVNLLSISVAFTASSIHHPRYTSWKKLKHGHFKWIYRTKHLPEILCHYFVLGQVLQFVNKAKRDGLKKGEGKGK